MIGIMLRMIEKDEKNFKISFDVFLFQALFSESLVKNFLEGK